MNQPSPLVRVSKKLSIEFNAIKQDIDEVYISVGMITDHMYEVVNRALQNVDTVSIVTGIHMATSPRVLDKLKEKADKNLWKAGIFMEKYFHPKLYLFKVKDSWIAFVGSGNFTDGGWFDNEELFVTVTDQVACESLFTQHTVWLGKSKPLTDELLNLYRETYFANSVKDKEKRKNVNDLIDNIQHKFNIDNINFAGQYFTKDDHLAFQPGKTHLDTDEILEERTKVRNKLYQLNDKIKAVLPGAWDLHDHYVPEHIVANIETRHHHESNVRGLWLAYGRGYDALKKYGEKDTTPLNFMRMQVIVQYKTIGLWLMPGKSGGSPIDREYFQQQIQDHNYMQTFYTLLRGLGEPYWIEIADEIRAVTSFDSPEALKNFLDNDNWRYYYFNIGINYEVGSPELTSDTIVNTVIQNFTKFYSLYEMIKDKFVNK
jgi:HKD family nuclease